MTAYDEDRMKKALKERCRANGCIHIGPKNCMYCGFNMREEDLRIKRGFVQDPKTKLWHMVPTQRPKPPQAAGAEE